MNWQPANTYILITVYGTGNKEIRLLFETTLGELFLKTNLLDANDKRMWFAILKVIYYCKYSSFNYEYWYVAYLILKKSKESR